MSTTRLTRSQRKKNNQSTPTNLASAIGERAISGLCKFKIIPGPTPPRNIDSDTSSSGLPTPLSSPVSSLTMDREEGGENYSVGNQQAGDNTGSDDSHQDNEITDK